MQTFKGILHILHNNYAYKINQIKNTWQGKIHMDILDQYIVTKLHLFCILLRNHDVALVKKMTQLLYQ